MRRGPVTEIALSPFDDAQGLHRRVGGFSADLRKSPPTPLSAQYHTAGRRRETLHSLASNNFRNKKRVDEGIKPLHQSFLIPIEVDMTANLRFGKMRRRLRQTQKEL